MSDGSFSSFIDTLQAVRRRSTVSPPAGKREDPIRLLALLPEDRRPIAVRDLLKTSSLGVRELSEGLKELHQQGLAVLRGTGAEETVALTSQGEATKAELNP